MTPRLLTVGFVSILGQVVLLRELAVALYGIELAYVLGIGAWLLGTGLGAAVPAKSLAPRPFHVSLLFFLFSILLPLDVFFIRAMRHVFGGVSGAYLPIPQQLLGIAVSLIPAGIILGLLFQWAARLYITGGRTMAGAYAVESAGAVFSGLLSTLTLSWGISNAGAALACAIVALVPVIVFRVERRGERVLRALALLPAGLLVLGCAKAPDLDRWMTKWNHPHLILTRDTPYGRATVTRLDRQISVYENDVLSFESEGTSAEEIVHLALLSHPRPRDVLILGGVLEGMALPALQHDPERVEHVELNAAMRRAVVPLLPEEVRRSLQDSRVRVIEGDPRRELTHLSSYDVIVVAASEPVSAQANRFYTRDFFEQVAAHLRTDGVLAFRLRSAENFWPEPLILRNGGILRALQSAFGNVLVLPGTSHLVLASAALLPADPDTPAERFDERGIEARLVQPSYIRYLYTNDRRAQIEEQFARAAAPVNTDERPICYHFALTVWLSKFYPRLLRAGSLWSQWPPWKVALSVALVCAVAMAVARLFARRRTELLMMMGVAGLCGMVIETVLLLRFQSEQGVLYQDIGVLLTLFMLGLAVGAGLTARLGSSPASGNARIPRASKLTLLSFAVLSFLIAWRIGSGGMAGIVEAGAALLICGALVAAVFGLAGFAAGSSRPGVGALYSADLVGGCVGSLTASLWLIPLAGLIPSAAACGLICLVALILVRR